MSSQFMKRRNWRIGRAKLPVWNPVRFYRSGNNPDDCPRIMVAHARRVTIWLGCRSNTKKIGSQRAGVMKVTGLFAEVWRLVVHVLGT